MDYLLLGLALLFTKFLKFNIFSVCISMIYFKSVFSLYLKIYFNSTYDLDVAIYSFLALKRTRNGPRIEVESWEQIWAFGIDARHYFRFRLLYSVVMILARYPLCPKLMKVSLTHIDISYLKGNNILSNRKFQMILSS